MGTALEILSGRVTNSVALIAATPATGDSFTVRSFPFEAGAAIESLWGLAVANRVVRVRSPRLHDNVENYRAELAAANAQPVWPEGVRQRLFPQDALSVSAASGAADTTAVSMLVYYMDLPGVSARLATWEQIASRVEHVMTIEQNLTTSATPGEYGGSQPIVADFDLLKANIDYAILGYVTDVQVASVGITSPDFGNLRVGGPGTTERQETRDWFKRLSMHTGLPHIPVFNASNKDSTFVDLLHNVAAVATDVDIICAQLAT